MRQGYKHQEYCIRFWGTRDDIALENWYWLRESMIITDAKLLSAGIGMISAGTGQYRLITRHCRTKKEFWKVTKLFSLLLWQSSKYNEWDLSKNM